MLDSASRAPQLESVSPESVGGNGKAPRGSTPPTTNSVLAACICLAVLAAHSQSRAPVQGATVDPKTTTASTPEGSATGWFSWPKFCWHNVLCTVFICLIAASAGGGAFAYLPSSVVVPDATALPTERGPLFASVRSFQACEAIVFDQLQLRGECDKMCANVTVEEPGSEFAMKCIDGLSADLPINYDGSIMPSDPFAASGPVNPLEDVETNVKAEIDEEEDEKKGKEKGAEKESSVHALPHTQTAPRLFA